MPLHQLAEKYEAGIKLAIIRENYPCICRGDSGNFIGREDAPDRLTLLTDRELGVYRSEVDPRCLCCLVVSKKSGNLYRVIANIDEKHEELTNFVSGVIS